jgi:integrase
VISGYPTRLITRMLYGCGLRVTEPLNLRVKDVLLGESRLILRGAKGGKDRIVPLPCSLVPEIKLQLRHARLVWEKDFSGKIPVPLPGRLASKYPDWQHAWKWAWVFPSQTTCVDDRTGKVVRFRCHEANVQRAVKVAARKLGLCVTPHQLRHAYATHAVRSGSNVRDVQEALGHSQINTTMNYLTPRACAVPSPLEVL